LVEFGGRRDKTEEKESNQHFHYLSYGESQQPISHVSGLGYVAMMIKKRSMDL
jgi:hypothetical protein